MDRELRREIIIDNYENPTNKVKISDEIINKERFIKINTNSESCIDNVDLFVKIDNDIITDLYFDGEACAISTSATSIMIKMFLGKDIKEAQLIIDNYYNMIEEKDYDESILEELNAYVDISKQPNRKKCAMLPFNALLKAIDVYKKNKNLSN